jgi:hypothetical protein
VASDIHATVAWLLIGLNALAGLWSLASHRWTQLQVPPMWWLITAGYLSAFVMAFTGTWLTTRSGSQLGDFHALYGFSTVIAVGILVSYRRSPFMAGRAHVLYGFGSLFVMGLGIRNLFLSPYG